jgi:hypothetical protein
MYLHFNWKSLYFPNTHSSEKTWAGKKNYELHLNKHAYISAFQLKKSLLSQHPALS